MKESKTATISLVALFVLMGVLFFWDAPVDLMKSLIGENLLIGSLAFASLMFLATVVAPITVLPMVPMVSPILGPFLTAILSIFSWTLGAVVAFLIARHAGRPFLSKFMNLKKFEKYEEHMGNEGQFMTIVLLRMVVPVDILSYALGLFSSVSLFRYTLATVIGVAYFSFAFAYIGEAAYSSNVMLLGIVAVASLTMFGVAWWCVVQKMRKKDD